METGALCVTTNGTRATPGINMIKMETQLQERISEEVSVHVCHVHNTRVSIDKCQEPLAFCLIVVALIYRYIDLHSFTGKCSMLSYLSYL